MFYGNDIIGFYVDKSYGYYYALNLLMFGFTVSGNELSGHGIGFSLFNLNIDINFRID